MLLLQLYIQHQRLATTVNIVHEDNIISRVCSVFEAVFVVKKIWFNWFFCFIIDKYINFNTIVSFNISFNIINNIIDSY